MLQQAEAQSVALFAVLKDARVHADGERLIVTLPSSLAFGKASTPDNRELLAAIIVRTTGDTPQLEYELASGPDAPAQPQAAPVRPGLTIAQRIALAKRELEGRVDLHDDDHRRDAFMNPQYQKMLRQVQDMQKAMAKAQEELAQETVEASAGGGTVTVVVTGSLEVREVRIDPAAVDPDDVEMLQDLVTAATNEALRAAQALAQQKLGGATSGVDLPNIPGLF